MPILNIESFTIKPGDVRKLQFNGGTSNMKKGTKVTVVCMRRDHNCATGFRVRIKLQSGEQKYLDAAWVDARLAKTLRLAHAKATREVFPEITTAGQFIEMFCKHMSVEESTIITRLEFKYVLRCCFGKCAPSDRQWCKHDAVYASTFDGERTGLIWCEEHKIESDRFHHAVKLTKT